MVPHVLAALTLILSALAVQVTPTTSATPTSAIPPVVWGSVAFTEAGGIPVTIADPSLYTVQFLPEGQVHARFDCNQGRGGYTAVDGVVTLTPMAVTTAMCAPDSYGLTVQRILGQATAYRFDAASGDLLLSGAGGELQLHPL